MGMFSQKPEEKAAWAPLPSEPVDRDDATALPEPPAADPLGLGLGGATSVSIPMGVTSVPITPDAGSSSTSGSGSGSSSGEPAGSPDDDREV